jgi:hypothetical protein
VHFPGGRFAGIAIATLGACALVPATASAGLARYGDLQLAYTQTTNSGGIPPPIRNEHSTYSPCGSGSSAGLAMLAGGGRIYDADLDPLETPFKLGQAWNVSLYPVSQIPPPAPDSIHQVADNRSSNASLSRGDGAVCGDVGNRSHVTNDKRSRKRGRTTVKVSCPGGKHVLGGGGLASGPFLSQRMVATAPFDSGDRGAKPDDGWRFTVDNLSNRMRKITAHAICAQVGGLTYVSKRFKAAKRKRKHAEASCPNGEFVIGGGLTHHGKVGKVSIVETYFDAEITHNHWYAEVDNLSRKRFKGRIHAICHS